MIEAPLVSAIITTYYRTEPLRAAIEGILNQSYTRLELIVVDDSGEAFAESIVEEYEDVEYIAHEENKGQCIAWETGVNAACGAYIQLNDDDDILKKSKIDKQVQILEETAETGVVYCGICHTSGLVSCPSTSVRGDILEDILMFNDYPCQTTSMLIRKEVLQDVFPLKPYPAARDDLLKIELAKRTRFDFVDEPLVIRENRKRTTEDSYDKIYWQLQLMDDYEELYEQLEPRTRQAVLAERYFELGLRYINRSLWSHRAIVAFSKSIYFSPDPKPLYLAIFVVSLFGRPGFKCAKWLRTQINSK